VWGMLHGQSHPKREWLTDLVPSLGWVEGDLLDETSLRAAISDACPDVIYNLGALTYVGMSWRQPTAMTGVTGLGVLRLLEAVRTVDSSIRVVHASTSEMFGSMPSPQNESTPFHPRSPYGVAKLFAHHTAINYRESYGMHVSCAVMFNHESPRRGREFVTRKVTSSVAEIVAGRRETLRLGNLDSRRDWGWAPDYVAALPVMAAADVPDDYVLATGEAHSIRELCETAFATVDLDWRDYVRIDPEYLRPADVEDLCGDASKARDVLKWEPTKRFDGIVRAMVAADLEAVRA
jgi:GDPmannose 4,6-dehydratase